MTAVDSGLPSSLPGDVPRPAAHRQMSHNGSISTPSRDDAMSTLSSAPEPDARCGGCQKIIDQDNGGIVVAFGQSLWHVDCFRCAKCNEKVSADTNLLLLSDGSPVCGNCSYQCFVCKKPITEEAIMTGDESYHAHCFTCRTCKRRIEELVFAKTTQGIYCMSCHNERVARSRRHAEAKRQRAARKEREAREREEADRLRLEGGGTPSDLHPRSHSTTPSTASLSVLSKTISGTSGTTYPTSSVNVTSPRSLASSYAETQRDLGIERGGSPSPSPMRNTSRATSPTSQRKPSAPTSPLIDPPVMQRGQSVQSNPDVRPDTRPPLVTMPSTLSASATLSPHHNMQTSPSAPNLGGGVGSPTRSVTPTTPNLGLGVGPVGAGGGSGGGSGLGVPTGRAEKRRSINPGMVFNMDAQNATFASEPRAPSPLRSSFNEQQGMPRSPGHMTVPMPLLSGGLDSRRGSAQSGDSPSDYRLPSPPPPYSTSPTRGQEETQMRTPALPEKTPSATSRTGSGPQPAAQSSAQGAAQASMSSTPIMSSPITRSPAPTSPPLPSAVEEPVPEPVAAEVVVVSKGDEDDSRSRNVPAAKVPDVPSDGEVDETPKQTPTPHAERIGASSPPKGENKDEQAPGDASVDADGKPRITTPGLLPTMSFSLSDPDFAVLLKEMEKSGKTPTEETPSRKGTVPRVRTESDSSRPSSPRVPEDGSSTPVRSPPKTTLTNGDDGSASPSRSFLSPTDKPFPNMRRRGSLESTLSMRIEPDSAFTTLSEYVASAKPNENGQISVDFALLQDALREHEVLRDTAHNLKNKYSGAKRSSHQYSEGLTVAGEEYDKEQAIRRDLEAEVVRLRAQVHSQTARLSVISSDERRAENLRRRSHDLASSLSSLEHDISRLRAQRDISVAEIEEINSKRNELGGNVDEATTKLGRSLTRRLEKIKEEYRDELGPLSAEREALQREINELRETREQFLEESTSLAAKNEDLAELNSQLSRQTEAMQDALARRSPAFPPGKARGHPSGSPSMSSIANALQDVPEETARVIKVPKPEPIEAAPVRRFKWIKSSKPIEVAAKAAAGAAAAVATGGGEKKERNNSRRPSTEMGIREHQFQQHSTMRLGRCELCNEKMWGLQEVKCASCGVICHSKCSDRLPKSCSGKAIKEDDGPTGPSMFGRDLTEQASADGAAVPLIVTKCIRAVEAVGMEYEGIYRKTGGSSQIKQITALFERQQYEKFDLADTESFNDISAVTSVLKTYFRSLPVPLLTHDLHESFVAAANIRDMNNKHAALCALLQELPKQHFDTLKVLMLHLNRVTAKSAVNLMTSQNLGVVFGPTLMRSADPAREFGDMAGKALTVQWMVDNAPSVFMEVEQREQREQPQQQQQREQREQRE